MKGNDWKTIELVFSTAIEMEGQERTSYLERACADSDWLLQEVNSLIDAFESNSTFIDDSGLDLGLKVLDSQSVKFPNDQAIGHFRIERLLGEGGMGDVYLAEDTKLGRRVALKFLNNPFLDGNWARRQMVKEARAAAMLDHSNICTVYGVEEIGEHRIIVMQYVKGQTLSHIIRERKIDAHEFLSLACQIVEAIAAAHESNIIHCDIKPGNVMLTDDGQVKVLDFGLAKFLHRPNKSGIEESLSRASQNGLIQGTVAYMSPEQLKGEKLDRRSDIFSLGTVLFELAVGEHPFAQKSDAETITAILTSESPVDGVAGSKIPVRLKTVIRRCLEQVKENRYQSADELLSELQSPPPSPSRVTALFIPVFAIFLLIILAAAGILMYSRSGKPHDTAVLPFTNETSDQGIDYIADGLTEGLIARLSGSERLRMTAYTMVSGYRGNNVDYLAAGREVSAELVVTGSLSRRDDQLIIRTNLFDTERGVVIRTWEDNVPQTDPLSFENIMAERLISLLAIDANQLTEIKRPGSTTEDSEAFRQFLIGRYYWKKRDPQNLQIAIAAFQKAIDLDPGYAKPYAGLADSYVLLSLVAYGTVPTKETMTKARAAAKQALAIDPFEAEAHTSLGIVLTKYDWNWSEAERELRLAIEIDPDYAAAHYWLSDVLAVTGKAEESIKEAERARELDPFSQQSEMNLARTYYYAREYDKALDILSKAGQGEKIDKKVRYMIGLVLIQKGKYADALKIFQEVSAENKMFAAAVLGYTYAKLGMKKEAFDVINELKTTSNDDPVPSEEIAFIYTALGDKENAFHHLNEAYRVRHAVLIALKVEPLFDPLRDDERFARLLQDMALS